MSFHLYVNFIENLYFMKVQKQHSWFWWDRPMVVFNYWPRISGKKGEFSISHPRHSQVYVFYLQHVAFKRWLTSDVTRPHPSLWRRIATCHHCSAEATCKIIKEMIPNSPLPKKTNMCFVFPFCRIHCIIIIMYIYKSIYSVLSFYTCTYLIDSVKAQTQNSYKKLAVI